ncbi:MAG: thioredoxin [Lachnospiraceae bacterium]|nr:thioredoxin [Lachnospiraceae bacterium]
MEINVTAENFDTEVLGSDIPVLVDFFATWCGPCKMLSPIVDRVADNYEGRLKVGKYDIDSGDGLTDKMGIMSVPTLKIFKGGEEVHTSVGAMSQADLEAIIDGIL